jgi:ribosome-binding protein aMBF1 (putative translation factor)
MIPFSYCEICGEVIPDLHEAFYTCSHVNADGYICRQCTMTAIQKTYPKRQNKGNMKWSNSSSQKGEHHDQANDEHASAEHYHRQH